MRSPSRTTSTCPASTCAAAATDPFGAEVTTAPDTASHGAASPQPDSPQPARHAAASVDAAASTPRDLFDLEGTDADALYRALLARDESYEGRAYVCVATTGIFCRLTCPARKPRPENCTFRPTIGACIEAGFRPCRRCHPLQPAASADPMIAALLAALDARPRYRFGEDDILRMGYDPSTVRRAFKRQFGMTFLDMARHRRLREGFETLALGGSVITAQQEAGFQSASAFRAAFARLMGCAPGDIAGEGRLLADWIGTPLGDMIAISSAGHLHLLEFIERRGLPAEIARLRRQAKGDLGIGTHPPTESIRAELAAYFAGRSAQFATPLALDGSAFSRAVWAQLREIPPGETMSYAEIARRMGEPMAARAVARANGANQLALVIPCHRVIGADGALTGYGGGLWRKQRLLEIEAQFRRPAPASPDAPNALPGR